MSLLLHFKIFETEIVLNCTKKIVRFSQIHKILNNKTFTRQKKHAILSSKASVSTPPNTSGIFGFPKSLFNSVAGIPLSVSFVIF
jgi:hypothetical protein